ncbi:HET-domain-containing protein [Cadophora sp. DSE1049]|nr:HET-domain-containing protein [Cadophora sp. DSE1049]
MSAEAQQPTTNSFRYGRLNTATRQIRLLRLHREVKCSDPVECSIEAFDLEYAPVYNALSYTWGDPLSTSCIIVNSASLRIRKNLMEFLKHFRNDNANNRYLFIDQICIDQGSNAERNQQVQLMADIYRRSSLVIIWLGCDEQFILAARRLNQSSHMPSLQILLGNKYFTRVWIVQEVMLASRARVLCGNVWLPWSSLELIVTRLPRLNTTSALPLGARNLLGERLKNNKAKPMLHDCLVRYRENLCHDPRDKVYGLLGLVDEAARVAVDYDKPVEEVFLDAAQSACNEYFIGTPGTSTRESSKPKGKVVGSSNYWTRSPVVGLWHLGRAMGMDVPAGDFSRYLRGMEGVWRHVQLGNTRLQTPGTISDLKFIRPASGAGDEAAYTCFDLAGNVGAWQYVIKGTKYIHTCQCNARQRGQICDNYDRGLIYLDGLSITDCV